MKTTTTRRKVIAGAATLPLLPAAALAVPLLPVPAFAAPADHADAPKSKVDRAISDFRYHFDNLPPKEKDMFGDFMIALAKSAQKYAAGVAGVAS